MAMLSKAEPNRLQRRLLTATALGLSLGLNNQAIANPFGTAPVSDGMLSSMRGGYELPNGMLISVGVQIETYVDNSLALRTVLNVTDRAKAALEIVVPSASKLGLSNPQVAAALPASAPVVTNPVAIADPTSIVQATPVVSAIAVAPAAADPAPAAPAVQIAAAAPIVSVASSAGDAQMPGVIAPADVQIHSDLGVVTVEQTSSGAAVLLKGPDLQIEHMTGNATGVLIANTLDNRVIDTVATVNISLTDSAIPVGNILLKIESIVLDAVGTNM